MFELAKKVESRLAQQLDRILASKAFRQADRLKRFLTFVLKETVAGRGECLKEFVVGIEVCGRDNSFDPRNDPIGRGRGGPPPTRVTVSPPLRSCARAGTVAVWTN